MDLINDKDILLSNVSLIHSTPMGINRIKKNLNIGYFDVVLYCKNIILDKRCHIKRRGKNWYCELDDIIITINANSYTIITAHLIKR